MPASRDPTFGQVAKAYNVRPPTVQEKEKKLQGQVVSEDGL